LLAAFLLIACAQVGEITGGEKDEKPPQLLGADPPHLSTRFTGDRITLRFDERVQLDRPRDRMLVSPPLDVAPTVRITGARNVTIDLNAPLKPNTTYSFAIGEAVKDLTEGNPAAGLVYVVSTGDFVDSLIVAGIVTDAFTGTPQKDVLVSLYDTADTLSLRTGRPAYATRSDAQGTFALRYVREGTYHLYALRDQNANYRYDLPNEDIAFLDAPVPAAPLDSLTPIHALRLFREASAVQQVREAKVTAEGAFRLTLARPALQVALRDIARTGGSLSWTPEWNAARDTVLLWPSDTTALGEGRYELRTEDGELDTLRYRPLERMPFNTGLRATVREQEDGAVVLLKAARPLAALDTGRFTVLRDSLPLPFTLERDSLDRRVLWLRTPLEPGASATLTVLPKGVRDIYGGHNDTLRTGIGRAAGQSTGTLRVKLMIGEGVKGPFILHLLDAQAKVLREAAVAEGGTVVWERLSPGDHGLRLIADTNANGRWDTGDLDAGVQPERTWRHAAAMHVRAAWDLGVEWKVE